MSALTKGLLALLVVVGVFAGVQTWRVRAAQRAGVEAAIAPAKEAAVVAKHEERQAAAALEARIDTVTRWLTRTVHDTVPAAALHPVTPADTTAAVAELPKVEARYQSCRVQLVAAIDECAAYKLRAERRFATDSTVIAKQDVVIRDRPARRHWSLGVTVGYGATLARDSTRALRLYTGPSLTAGLTWTPF
jgi:hypothetical protein